jgi:hypothetical protein
MKFGEEEADVAPLFNQNLQEWLFCLEVRLAFESTLHAAIHGAIVVIIIKRSFSCCIFRIQAFTACFGFEIARLLRLCALSTNSDRC